MPSLDPVALAGMGACDVWSISASCALQTTLPDREFIGAKADFMGQDLWVELSTCGTPVPGKCPTQGAVCRRQGVSPEPGIKHIINQYFLSEHRVNGQSEACVSPLQIPIPAGPVLWRLSTGPKSSC